MKQFDVIPIVFAADNNYLPYMSVTIQSIIENSSLTRKYCFIILYREIADESKEIITRQIDPHPQFSIEFINVSDCMSKYNLFISRHITVETWFRLLIPDLLQKYKKAIYLDCDVIVCADIAEFFDFDLKDNLIAAIRDIDSANWFYGQKTSRKVKGYRNSFLNLKNPSEYFCAGVCLFNIQLFREVMPTEKLFELAISNKWDFHDQDVLNIAAEGKVYFLPWQWGGYITGNTEFLPENLKGEYEEAKKNPKIVHFAATKPWKSSFFLFHFDLFWKYATRTPFIDVILKRMGPPETQSLKKMVLLQFGQKRLGLRFILFCVKEWLFRKMNK